MLNGADVPTGSHVKTRPSETTGSEIGAFVNPGTDHTFSPVAARYPLSRCHRRCRIRAGQPVDSRHVPGRLAGCKLVGGKLGAPELIERQHDQPVDQDRRAGDPVHAVEWSHLGPPAFCSFLRIAEQPRIRKEGHNVLPVGHRRAGGRIARVARRFVAHLLNGLFPERLARLGRQTLDKPRLALAGRQIHMTIGHDRRRTPGAEINFPEQVSLQVHPVRQSDGRTHARAVRPAKSGPVFRNGPLTDNHRHLGLIGRGLSHKGCQETDRDRNT